MSSKLIENLNNLEQRIVEIWRKSVYNIPDIHLIYHEGTYMVIVDDKESFIRFMSFDGQIFLVNRVNCSYVEIGNTKIYTCIEAKVYPILCSPSKGTEEHRDTFVRDNIAILL